MVSSHRRVGIGSCGTPIRHPRFQRGARAGWVVERTFGWISRHRRMSKDYERKVQTSETLIQVAMIRLLLARLGCKNEPVLNHPAPLGHKPFPMAFGDNFDDAINHLYAGLIVNRVGRHRHDGGPSFSVGQGIVRQIGII